MLTNDFVGLFQQRFAVDGCVSLFIIYSLNKDISLRQAWLADKYTTLVARAPYWQLWILHANKVAYRILSGTV
ncbi:Uncharacterised protein [Escherichia coli]|nr:Uncharacterised protein [Escherichia coli]SQR05099.1 Uncharacterised protein [Escherichia coli]